MASLVIIEMVKILLAITFDPHVEFRLLHLSIAAVMHGEPPGRPFNTSIQEALGRLTRDSRRVATTHCFSLQVGYILHEHGYSGRTGVKAMTAFCIYAITHTASGKRYIGSSVNHGLRWKAHAGHLKRGTHHCRKLQKAWIEHGADAFRFEILEWCEGDRTARHDAELKWIKASDHYNSMAAHLTLNQFENSPETRQLIAVNTQKARGTQEARERQSELLKAAWADPNSGIRNRKQSELPEATLQSKAEKMAAFHASPEGQALKARRSAKLRAYWANPNSGLRNRSRPLT